jgi:hypothetical protein
LITEIQIPHPLPDTKLRIPLSKVGFPIRKSADQSFFAAPRGLSQRSTSFIASQRQGIHQMPLFYLITLIINAHPSSVRSWKTRQSFQQQDMKRSMADTNFAVRINRTLSRKTSFTCFKIEPTARRSSFADKTLSMHHRWILVKHSRALLGVAQNVLASGRNECPERSPLHDVRQHATARAPVVGAQC